MVDKDKLRAVYKRILDVGASLKKLKGWSGVLGFFRAIPWVVDRVEVEAKELNIKGTSKKELAIDILVLLIPDTWLPDWVLRPLLSYLINKAVEKLNEKVSASH